MNGYEATREIRRLAREDARQIPIVAMTADAFSSDIKMALNAGMNEHLSKPGQYRTAAGSTGTMAVTAGEAVLMFLLK